MNREQQERQEGPFTKEQVIEAFESGDRMEGMRRFDEWQNRRQAETDTSYGRLTLNVEILEVYASSESSDVVLYEVALAEQAISSDTSLSESERRGLLDRVAQVNASM